LTPDGASITLLPVRRKTRTVKAGKLISRCGLPISVQTMWKERFRKDEATDTLEISPLLAAGIWDTVRASFSVPPRDEVTNVRAFFEQVSFFIQEIEKHLTIAAMGCPVNGPGDEWEADLGITGGDRTALICRNGEVMRGASFAEAEAGFREEMEKVCASK
jgi:4-hydroxy-3-methylbut-2-en-1-yl diphosphate synthase IspG/GcpE